ncbi:hypothetical protein [Breznakiella homolactica]|uniref:hypothetical protein n=1 Tax=Breznakiella homolactica TaxID=2798577 RepID=UPI001CBA692A|nr:hypothetical protein [Breznakiella homolactica]
MRDRMVISVVLNAHLPFIRHPDMAQACEERRFFELVSDTYLPLLGVFDRLEADHVPFRIALALSPTLCHMLSDELLLDRYLNYVDARIELGAREVDRTAGDPVLNGLARMTYSRFVEERVLFTERYERNILKVLSLYQKKGRVELLTTAATHSFLPFYTEIPEAVQSQIEVALANHRSYFGKNPQGFWLPELGWTPELDEYLRAYNFSYTIVSAHGLVTGTPPAVKGSFYPIKTPGEP